MENTKKPRKHENFFSILVSTIIIGIIMIWLSFPGCYNTVYAQPKNSFYSDTTFVMLCYSDTSCHFIKDDIQSIYNSKCLKWEKGYLVESDYFRDEYLDSNKKTLNTKYTVWYHDLIKK